MDESYEVVPLPARITGLVGDRLTVPTHVTPAGGQTTHPSVLFFPEGWNGFEYWMAHTPYPAGNDDHEDPNIVASHDGITWVVPPGLTNPIDDQSGQPAYNSDVDLKLGPGDVLFLFWRTFDPNAVGGEEQLYYSTSVDGVTWATKIRYYQANMATLRMVSPTLLLDDDHWVMWAVDAVPSPNRVVRLVSATLDPAGAWTAPATVSVGTMQAGKEPWHLFVTRQAGRYVGLLNDCTTGSSGAAGDLLFLSSTTGTSFANSGKTVIPRVRPGEHDQLYRATLAPAYEEGVLGFRVWYAAWRTTGPVWNVYRTWIGPQSSAAGELHPPASIAPGGFAAIPVTFPAGAFTTPPHVDVSTDSTRLTLGSRNITATGFELLASNWTSAAVSTAAWLYWGASPR